MEWGEGGRVGKGGGRVLGRDAWGEEGSGGGRGEGLQGVEEDLSSCLFKLSYNCHTALCESKVWRTLT